MTSSPVATPTSVARSGRAMACRTEIVVVGHPDAAPDDLVELVDRAEQRIAHFEALWSRFLPTSDIARLNGAAGRPTCVHPATVDLVVHMVQAHVATDGAFDPTLLPVLVAQGYAASRDDETRVCSLSADIQPGGRVSDVLVDLEADVVQLPPRMSLDPGGVGKGLAADHVVADLLAHGAAGALVGIGGDVRVSGDAPQVGAWSIGLDDPLGRASSVQVRLADGAVASSGTDRRRWTDDGGHVVHHLLHPRTRTSLPEGGASPVGATVVAGTGAWADVWTKALMVHGARVLDDLDAVGLAGRVVLADGSSICSAAWPRVAVDRAATTASRPLTRGASRSRR